LDISKIICDKEYLNRLIEIAKYFPMTSEEALKPKVVSERNQLTQKQTTALIKLWEAWRTNGVFNRIAHSPYGVPYISIERRNYLINKQFEWDWCISYAEMYDGQGTQIIWYSNSKDPMPKQIKDFLRHAYDREILSNLQTN
jgi:hypothetical protein